MRRKEHSACCLCDTPVDYTTLDLAQALLKVITKLCKLKDLYYYMRNFCHLIGLEQ